MLDLVKKLLEGDKRACARAITKAENNEKGALEILKEIYKYTGNAHIVGITGPPGGGKSTLTYRLSKELSDKGKKVGIIAIDPTSPFTGGSILGDRIRMNKLSTDPNVFIRSMGTRGHLGGLSKATYGAIKIFDAFGCDYIFIETVGVGQSEVDIVKTADTVVMVMVPGLGDDIQAIKAGIMEIADIFAINKSDLDGAERTTGEIKMMVEMDNSDKKPPILNVIASQNEGIEDLVKEIICHKEYLVSSGELEGKRTERLRSEIIDLVEQEIKSRIFNDRDIYNLLDNILKDVYNKEVDPYSAKDELFNAII
ncbi:methylmalonyl Co-A mutase-associated GTPase MeaB [Senegalia massiliensis]|uniref:Methylmalonyl Co-A mutase-associated GTPase MeaB n=1 Tax=Senegalia massiliensis TaxID=1720316 RepID=A0A845R1U6_9CLOT|nr:methylmalonyl Co-A mutase-associated GTPase MeaB [Senegalia massiliensis]